MNSKKSNYTRKQYKGLIPFTVIDRSLISNAPASRGDEVDVLPNLDYYKRGVVWEPSRVFSDRMMWVGLQSSYEGKIWIDLVSLTDETKYLMAGNQIDVLVTNNIPIIDRIIDTDWTFTKQGAKIYLIPYIK